MEYAIVWLNGKADVTIQGHCLSAKRRLTVGICVYANLLGIRTNEKYCMILKWSVAVSFGWTQ